MRFEGLSLLWPRNYVGSSSRKHHFVWVIDGRILFLFGSVISREDDTTWGHIRIAYPTLNDETIQFTFASSNLPSVLNRDRRPKTFIGRSKRTGNSLIIECSIKISLFKSSFGRQPTCQTLTARYLRLRQTHSVFPPISAFISTNLLSPEERLDSHPVARDQCAMTKFGPPCLRVLS